jgi:hypothetical protein
MVAQSTDELIAQVRNEIATYDKELEDMADARSEVEQKIIDLEQAEEKAIAKKEKAKAKKQREKVAKEKADELAANEKARIGVWDATAKPACVAESDVVDAPASSGEKLSMWGHESKADESAIEESVRVKGKQSYYYAHTKQKDGVEVEWDGNEQPKKLDKEIAKEEQKTEILPKKLDGTAAEHTYDAGYRKWEKFDESEAIKQIEEAVEESKEEAVEDVATDAIDGDFKFIATGTFEGPKPGYVFKAGEEGVGYYQDATSAGVCKEWQSFFGKKKTAPAIPVFETEGEESGWSGMDDVL